MNCYRHAMKRTSYGKNHWVFIWYENVMSFKVRATIDFMGYENHGPMILCVPYENLVTNVS